MKTSYTVKLENNDVWVFKYNLKGLLVGYEVLDGELSDKQFEWLFPQGKLPIKESIIDEWRKKKNLKIVLDEPDISFENLWKQYGYTKSKQDSEKAYSKLNKGEKIKCFLALKDYEKDLAKSGTAKAHLSTWINKKRFNDEY